MHKEVNPVGNFKRQVDLIPDRFRNRSKHIIKVFCSTFHNSDVKYIIGFYCIFRNGYGTVVNPVFQQLLEFLKGDDICL